MSTFALHAICAGVGDPSYVSRDFLSHVHLRHRCDYSVLADFEADEESMLRRAVQESMRDAKADDEAALELAIAASAREAHAAGISTGDGEGLAATPAPSTPPSSPTSPADEDAPPPEGCIGL